MKLVATLLDRLHLTNAAGAVVNPATEDTLALLAADVANGVGVQNVGGGHLAIEIHDANTGTTTNVTAGGRLSVEAAGLTDTLTQGTISAAAGANSMVTVPDTALNAGQSSFTVDLHPQSANSWSAGTVVVIEGTLDGVDWTSIHVFDLTMATTHTGTFAGPGPYTARGVCGGFLQLRARALAYAGNDQVKVKFRTTVADTATAVINFPALQPVTDRYTGGQADLPDQAGANGVLTFAFTTPVDLVWVRLDGGSTNGRCDPFGGTPSATQGIIAEPGIPVPMPVTAQQVKVWAPVGATVQAYGYRY